MKPEESSATPDRAEDVAFDGLLSPSVDLCVRLLIRSEFNYDRDMKRSEILGILIKLFDEDDIQKAIRMVTSGFIVSKNNEIL